jgi:hypothetical protein
VILNESALVSCTVPEKQIRDLVLGFQVSEWNFSKTFFSDWRLPHDHEGAHARVLELFQGNRLVVVCRNVACFAVDRAGSHPELLLVRATPPETQEAYLGPLTVFGSGFLGESDLLTRLAESKEHFFHWVLNMTSARLDIVAEDIELPNFPRRPD